VPRFRFAGLPIEVVASQPGDLDDLAPIYARFATAEPPRLVITVARVAGFDREPGPGYPAFERRATDDGRLRVERYDAEGVVDVTATPVTATFRVGPSANSLEACVRIAASVALARDGAVILHASAVAHAGRALVFTGVSGAGKSTISSMLADAYPSCAKIADELLVLRPTDAGVTLEVPPYLGPAGVAHGASAPLAAIHFLVQALRSIVAIRCRRARRCASCCATCWSTSPSRPPPSACSRWWPRSPRPRPATACTSERTPMSAPCSRSQLPPPRGPRVDAAGARVYPGVRPGRLGRMP
jgi:hypothetical protein